VILSPHEIAWLVIPRWPAAHHQKAVAVFLAESGGDTEAIGRSGKGENLGQRDHGLTQVSGRWHGVKLVANPHWRDPEVAVDLAFAVWLEAKNAGKDPWTPWSVYNGPDGTPGEGRFKDFLPDAKFGLAHPFPPPPRPATSLEVVGLTAAIAALNARVQAIAAHFREVDT
jgi:Lysozyme like domain